MTYHLGNTKESFVMSYQCICKNRYLTLANSNQRVPGYVPGNNVFYILVARKDVPAISSVSGFKQRLADEIDAFMMAFEEHGAFLYYIIPPLNYHGALFINGFSAPSFVTLGKSFPDKTDSFSAA